LTQIAQMPQMNADFVNAAAQSANQTKEILRKSALKSA